MIGTTSKFRTRNYRRTAKRGLTPHFVNKVLLGDSHALSFMYCLRLISCTEAELSSYNRNPMAHKAYSICYLTLPEKSDSYSTEVPSSARMSGYNGTGLCQPDKEHVAFSLTSSHWKYMFPSVLLPPSCPHFGSCHCFSV